MPESIISGFFMPYCHFGRKTPRFLPYCQCTAYTISSRYKKVHRRSAGGLLIHCIAFLQQRVRHTLPQTLLMGYGTLNPAKYLCIWVTSLISTPSEVTSAASRSICSPSVIDAKYLCMEVASLIVTSPSPSASPKR